MGSYDHTAGNCPNQSDPPPPDFFFGDFIAGLMTPVSEAGQFASWISAPKVGIDNKPGDFEYVKIET